MNVIHQVRTSLWVVAILLSWLMPSSADDAVDLVKVEKDHFTRFVRYGIWPSEKTIEKCRVPCEAVGTDTNSLKQLLGERLRGEQMPSAVDFDKNLMACTNLLGLGDHLLLRYVTTNNVKVEIQESAGLNVLIDDSRVARVSLLRIEDLVKRMGVDYILFPGTPTEALTNLSVFVSAADIGASKCGLLSYGPNIFPPQYWYSSLMWWSDGRRVLYGIPRGGPMWVNTRSSNPDGDGSRRFSD